MIYLRTLALCAALCACAVDAYKILVVFPFPGKSHGILGEGVVRNLLKAGHEVTYVTPFVKDNPHPKLHQIDVSMKNTAPSPLNLKAVMDKELNLFDVGVFFNMTVGAFRETMKAKDVQRFLADPKQSFDLVIAEWLYIELYAGFGAVFNCPFIWVSTVEPHSSILSLIDEGLNPAYNSALISVNTPPFTFMQRVKELFLDVSSSLLKKLYFTRIENEEYEREFAPFIRKRGLPVHNFEDVVYNASLVLGNSHVAMGQATRLPQNYKSVGGYHIDTDFKPLPADLKKLLDNAKHGVIYFSMGSNLKSKELPDVVKRDLISMFGSLKQTVLWKFEEVLPGLPDNVHIVQWAPQLAILDHPNVVLFITHGGLLSTTETIHFGKPIVGIPVFADQFTNVKRAEAKGYGKAVELSYNLASDLKLAIQEVLTNPKYSNRAKELSMLFHHRPVPPGQELVHWVEHVVMTRGAPHLRSLALHVPFYQKMYLDLAALILAIVLALRTVCKFILCRLCRRKRIDSDKKKKKQ